MITPDFKYYPRGSVSEDGRYKHIEIKELEHGLSEAPWELLIHRACGTKF